MANPQSLQNKEHELFGAVKVEFSTLGVTYVDAGAVNAAVFTENLVVSTLETDNAVDEDTITDQTSTITFDQFEFLSEAARVIVRGSIDTVENIAGVLVSSAIQNVAAGYAYDTFIPIENQNGSGAAVVVNDLDQDPGGTPVTLTVVTDYSVVKNDDGIYGVIIYSTGTANSAFDFDIDYDYTPSASQKVSTGGISDLPTFYTRLTNIETISGVEYTNQWIFFVCNTAAGTTLEFKKYNAEDTRVPVPVTINVKQDITRVVGKRLYERNITPPRPV